MDKIERWYFLFIKQIRERPQQDNFTTAEYKELLRQIINWCESELRGKA